jgi:hypothetical protein
MRILIRNVTTRLYLNSGDWVEDIDQARDFEVGPDAIVFAVTHHLNNFEIIYAFPNPDYNLGTGRIDFSPEQALQS